jgi:DNA mismatch endonuclease, patch repair protein
MDNLTPAQRSYNMLRIKNKDTRPESIVRSLVWHKGYRYRLHYNRLPGKPDIVFPGRKKVIFINGCFWHKHDCRYFVWPSSNKEYWIQKIKQNVIRDHLNYELLNAEGWGQLVIWECETKSKNLENLWLKIEYFLK